ncbi:MAG: DUF190 domain-containing protein [Candidatus Baltobacteraceae bacterium]
MDGFQNGKMLRIFVDEHDRHGVEPLYTAVVELLRKRGVAGATVLRGIEGFGTHHRIHIAKPFSPAPNSPVLIEVVDEEDRLRALIPELKAMIGEGLISLENISYLRLQRP